MTKFGSASMMFLILFSLVLSFQNCSGIQMTELPLVETQNRTAGVITPDVGSASAASSAAGTTAIVPVDPNQIDVFLIAGQSNAVGITEDPSMVGVPSVPPGIAYQYNQVSNQDGFCGQAPAPAGLSGVSGQQRIGTAHCGNAWSQFAISYYQKTGRKIAFVFSAVGGSSLVASVQKYVGAPDNWEKNAGNLFANAASAVPQAMIALSSQGKKPEFKGILWIQGEGDALAISAGRLTQANYENALRQLVQNFRDSFQSKVPFYIFQIGTNLAYFPNDGGYGNVRAVQNAVESQASGIFVVSREAITFGALGLMHDTVHYNQLGYNQIGKVGAESIVEIQNGRKPVGRKDGVISISTGQSSTLEVTYTIVVNSQNSCASSNFTFSFGDNIAAEIQVLPNFCGPSVYSLKHHYSNPGKVNFRLDTGTIYSHQMGEPIVVLQSGTYEVK